MMIPLMCVLWNVLVLQHRIFVLYVTVHKRLLLYSVQVSDQISLYREALLGHPIRYSSLLIHCHYSLTVVCFYSDFWWADMIFLLWFQSQMLFRTFCCLFFCSLLFPQRLEKYTNQIILFVLWYSMSVVWLCNVYFTAQYSCYL